MCVCVCVCVCVFEIFVLLFFHYIFQGDIRLSVNLYSINLKTVTLF